MGVEFLGKLALDRSQVGVVGNLAEQDDQLPAALHDLFGRHAEVVRERLDGDFFKFDDLVAGADAGSHFDSRVVFDHAVVHLDDVQEVEAKVKLFLAEAF